MKFALVNDEKSEAIKGAKGNCPGCGSELIAKCGEVKINHWSHKGNRNCDPWWENETEWHRNWKGQFPIGWQEIVHFDDSGEKHIADVKTESGFVLEFQYSYLNPEERRSRNAFYKKLVWVVNGLRRKTDILQYQKALNESSVIWKEPLILQINFPEECRLLREWQNSDALVFFDFQETKEAKQSRLWFLFPKVSDSKAYISPFSRESFIELHNKNEFDEIVSEKILSIRNTLIDRIQNNQSNKKLSVQNRLPAFERHLAKRRRRRRF